MKTVIRACALAAVLAVDLSAQALFPFIFEVPKGKCVLQGTIYFTESQNPFINPNDPAASATLAPGCTVYVYPYSDPGEDQGSSDDNSGTPADNSTPENSPSDNVSPPADTYEPPPSEDNPDDHPAKRAAFPLGAPLDTAQGYLAKTIADQNGQYSFVNLDIDSPFQKVEVRAIRDSVTGGSSIADLTVGETNTVDVLIRKTAKLGSGLSPDFINQIYQIAQLPAHSSMGALPTDFSFRIEPGMLRLSVPVGQRISIAAFGIDGRLVQNILPAHMVAPGAYAVTFPNERVSSQRWILRVQGEKSGKLCGLVGGPK